MRAIEQYLVLTIDHGFNASTFAAAGGRLDRSRPGRGHRRRRRGAVGTAPRRGPQPGPRHAGCHRHTRTGPRPGSAGRSTGGTGSWASGTGSTRPTTPGRSSSASVARGLGGDLVDFAEQVERTTVGVLADVKPGRRLYTNVEFFAGVVMHTCGIPRSMFTPTFAAGRVIGWCAHVMEQAGDNRLIRPAARYVGPPPPQPVPPR